MSEEHIAYILREVVKVSNLTRVSYLKNYLSVVVKKKYLSTFKYIIVNKKICGLQLPLEPHRSPRLLQLTGRWQNDGIM